jgi:membrane-bound metal-dependent hydrolase YbcI (DUF457 family)
MFIGHYAVAFAAKKAAPKASLGTLFMASQLLDLIWPILLLLGIEHVKIAPGNTVVTPLDFYDYPITHSLTGALGWALVFSLFYYYIRRDVKDSVIIALCVFSHWILDFITHRADLPLSPSSDKFFGLGLWNSLSGTLVVEGGLFIAGIALYVNFTSAKDNSGKWSFWSLVALLLIIYSVNIFGKAPPDESVIPFAGLAAWLFIPWAYWIDKHRILEKED